jgi:hypothetical protein
MHHFPSHKSDWVGIASASLCVVHCLLTPVLIALTATFGWWSGLSYLFLLISFYAAFETSHHSQGSPWLWLIWVSFAALAASVLFEDDYEWLHWASYLASASLVTGHVFNSAYCKKCHPNED